MSMLKIELDETLEKNHVYLPPERVWTTTSGELVKGVADFNERETDRGLEEEYCVRKTNVATHEDTMASSLKLLKETSDKLVQFSKEHRDIKHYLLLKTP